MVNVAPDAELVPGQNAFPVLWVVSTPAVIDAARYSDADLARFLPGGRGRALRSFGHDENTAHWLLTRGGTPLHTDPAYARYSHQLVLRNDGNRLRGLPRFDQLHPPLLPGVMYLLDTHSPHIGLPDGRLGRTKVQGMLKIVAAVDAAHPMTAAEVWPLLAPLAGRELPEGLDPGYSSAPRRALA